MKFLGKVVVLTAITCTFTNMQITHAVGTDAPTYDHRGSLLHFFSLITVWMVFFIFGTYNLTSAFPKNKLKYVSNAFWPISDDFGPRELRGVSAQNEYNFKLLFLMQHWTVLCDNNSPKYSLWLCP